MNQLQVIVAKARARAFEIRKAEAEGEEDAAGAARLAALEAKLDAALARLDALGAEPDDAVAKAEGDFDESSHPRADDGKFGSGGSDKADKVAEKAPVTSDDAKAASRAARVASIDARAGNSAAENIVGHGAAADAHREAGKAHEAAAATAGEGRAAHETAAADHAKRAAEHDEKVASLRQHVSASADRASQDAKKGEQTTAAHLARGENLFASRSLQATAASNTYAAGKHEEAAKFALTEDSKQHHEQAASEHRALADEHAKQAVEQNSIHEKTDADKRKKEREGFARRKEEETARKTALIAAREAAAPAGTTHAADYGGHLEKSGITLDGPVAAVETTFGERAPSVEALEKTWGHSEGGFETKLTEVGAGGLGSGGTFVQYQGNIVHDGEVVGEIGRTFSNEDGVLSVHHDLFKLDDAGEQSRGLGAAMMKQSIQAYEKMGVDKVTVSAAWVGKYTWASMGYNWNFAEATKREGQLRDFLVKNGVERERAAGLAKAAAPRAWDVAALDVDGKKAMAGDKEGGGAKEHSLGKAFLLQGDGWAGTLSLDKASPSYQRAAKRLGL